jgi:methylenetetrahydrofolate reductase (NADPH)
MRVRGKPRTKELKGRSMQTQKKLAKSFSFEFFPPRDEDARVKLRETTRELAALKPKFFSVTFGAAGSTRDGTFEAVQEIIQAGLKAAPHISGICSTQADIRDLLTKYRGLGVDRLVVLRGDRPKEGNAPVGEFRYGNELVEFIRRDAQNTFHIEVAAYPEFHPESPSAQADLDQFARKVRAGANSAITQYFFNVDAYCRFVDESEARGLDLPIVPGIMPITNYKQLVRFSDACGAEIPRWIRARLEGFGDDLESLRTFGLDVTTALCEKLLAVGAPGLHFYTLNRTNPTRQIWQRLGI